MPCLNDELRIIIVTRFDETKFRRLGILQAEMRRREWWFHVFVSPLLLMSSSSLWIANCPTLPALWSLFASSFAPDVLVILRIVNRSALPALWSLIALLYSWCPCHCYGLILVQLCQLREVWLRSSLLLMSSSLLWIANCPLPALWSLIAFVFAPDVLVNVTGCQLPSFASAVKSDCILLYLWCTRHCYGLLIVQLCQRCEVCLHSSLPLMSSSSLWIASCPTLPSSWSLIAFFFAPVVLVIATTC
jgi:hypothetical protein